MTGHPLNSDMRESAKQIFLQYAAGYDRNNGMIELKILHTLEVAKVMCRLVSLRQVPARLSDLAYITAVFHDIGRFQQAARYGTFLDHLSVDHADFGCEVLEQEHFPEELGLTGEEKQMVLTAIHNHNKLTIQPGLDPETELLCRLIRDADKLDIFRVFACEEMEDTVGVPTEVIRHETITPEVFDCIRQHRCVDKRIRRTNLDKWVGFLGFLFDLNFPESVGIVKESGYYRRPFDETEFTRPETRETVEQVLAMVEEYLYGQQNRRQEP